MESIPFAHHCGLYRPGHDVHYIQARLTWSEPTHPPIPGTLLEVHEDGELVVDLGGEIHRYWNHDPRYVHHCVDRNEGAVTKLSHGILATAADGGRKFFCVADIDSDLRRACLDPDEPLPDGPVELLTQRGGFSMSGTDALRWLDGHERDG